MFAHTRDNIIQHLLSNSYAGKHLSVPLDMNSVDADGTVSLWHCSIVIAESQFEDIRINARPKRPSNDEAQDQA